MSENTGFGFQWRAVDDLPFARIAIFTAAIFITAWKLTSGRLLVLSPALMKHEFLRFLTLLRYPRQNKLDLISIAVAGFYHDGNADALICYMCGLTVYGITRTDNPLRLHIEKSENCAFLLRNRENNRICFNRRDSENDLLQTVENGEFVTLEHLNNMPGNAIENIGENEAGHNDHRLIGSADASDQSVEGDFDHDFVGNETQSLPFPVGVPEVQIFGLEQRRDRVHGNFDIESDLNVSLTDDSRVQDACAYNFQTINEQDASAQRQGNHQDDDGFPPEPGNSDTAEVNANNSLRVRDGQNEVYRWNEGGYDGPGSLGSLTYNEQQDTLIRAETMCNEAQLLSPSAGANLGLNLSSNMTYNNTSERMFNRVSSLMIANMSQEILRRHYHNVYFPTNTRTDEKVCKACQTNIICYAFIPCGHVACKTCTEVVNVCPRCHHEIQRRISLRF